MGALAGLISVVVGAWFAWTFGLPLTGTLGWSEHLWLAPGLVFIAAFLTTNAILASALTVLQLAGGGIWTASPVRWLVGKFAFLLLLIPAFWIVGILLQIAGLSWGIILAPVGFLLPVKLAAATPPDWFEWSVGPGQGFRPGWLLANLSIFAALLKLLEWEKIAVAYGTRPLRRFWRAIKTGVGGSAAFNGLLDEWMIPWREGKIILGTSLYEPGQKLGKSDDRHCITVATTRSGKGRSCVIPNLLTWPGSALVIDPKGENAAVTALARRRMGQKVHIVDPFKLLERLGLDPEKYPSHRLNPLAEIRLDDLEAVEQIRNLAAALVMISPHANPFWDEASRVILAGAIAHVLTSDKVADTERHLGTVRDYVTETNKRTMFELRGNKALGGLPDKAEAMFKKSSDSAGGDIMTTLNVHMEWIDSPAMKEAMAASDFSFAELKHEESTVYLVIPPEYLDTHARYLRLFITLALKAAGRGRKARHAMLFILDEFAALGELKVVAVAAGVQAGGGVKLWPIIQSLTQLKQYGDNWEIFLSSAGQQQVFAMNDEFTARYFSEKLGNHMAWRKVKTRTPKGYEYEWMPQGATWLRTGPELARESSRDGGKALVFFEGGEVSLVRRAAYDFLFTKEQYAPNPYQTAPAFFSRAGVRAEGGIEKWWDALTQKAWDRIDPPARREARRERFGNWFQNKFEKKEDERTPTDVQPDPSAKVPLSLDELRAEYLKMDAYIRASNFASMTPEEKSNFGSELNAAFKPFFDAMTALGVTDTAEMDRQLGIGDDPALQELRRDKEADAEKQGTGPDIAADAVEAAPQETPFAKASANRPDAPPLPKPLKAPPLKKPRKPRAKKPPP